jgi:hypothetical protein
VQQAKRRMDRGCVCATKSTGSREPPSNNNMFQRIIKKFKGSHPGDEDPSTDAVKSTTVNEKEGASRKPEEPSASTPSEPGHDDHDHDHDHDDDSSSSGSDSSIEDYSYEEMIVVPTRRNNGEPASPPSRLTAGDPASRLTAGDPHNFDLQLLARTQFPDFGVPDGELTDSSDDESLVQQKEERYKTKEDQDVAVFMDLSKRMSMKSYLHILQGHVRTQNISPEYLQHYSAALSQSGATKSPSDETETDMVKKPLPRQKQFRWAEVANEKVRVVVCEIESIKEEKSLWWTPEEMHAIRAELIDVVKFFRKRRPNYITSVETIARHTAQESVIEDHMKKLTEDSFARGLEGHVVKMISDHRKNTIQAVLDEQKECRMCNDNAETTSHCMREQSLAYSQMSTRFAACMAKCDEIDALKANMSRWRANPPAATTAFFDT